MDLEKIGQLQALLGKFITEYLEIDDELTFMGEDALAIHHFIYEKWKKKFDKQKKEQEASDGS